MGKLKEKSQVELQVIEGSAQKSVESMVSSMVPASKHIRKRVGNLLLVSFSKQSKEESPQEPPLRAA